jgi:hypothetical protein
MCLHQVAVASNAQGVVGVWFVTEPCHVPERSEALQSQNAFSQLEAMLAARRCTLPIEQSGAQVFQLHPHDPLAKLQHIHC